MLIILINDNVDIKMVSDEIVHSPVVMTEKYAKFNFIKLRDDS